MSIPESDLRHPLNAERRPRHRHEQAPDLEAERQRDQETLEEAYRIAFASPEGQMVLADLVAVSQIDEPMDLATDFEPYKNFFRRGKEAMVQYVRARIKTASAPSRPQKAKEAIR